MYTCLAVVLHSISVILTQSETIHRYLTIYRKYVESVVVTIHSRLPLIRTFKGNRKKFEFNRELELSRVKLYRRWSEGKWKLRRVSGRFKLYRVLVNGNRLYFSYLPTLQLFSWNVISSDYYYNFSFSHEASNERSIMKKMAHGWQLLSSLSNFPVIKIVLRFCSHFHRLQVAHWMQVLKSMLVELIPSMHKPTKC